MVKPVGGRGKVAPYETTHVRIPLPIKEQVDELVNRYREAVLLDGSYEMRQSTLVGLEDAIEISGQILKQKKSARESLAKLLTAIYTKHVSPSEL